MPYDFPAPKHLHDYALPALQHSPPSRFVCRLNDEKLNGKFDTADKWKLESAAINDGHMTVTGHQ
jgi:hypothetical protein